MTVLVREDDDDALLRVEAALRVLEARGRASLEADGVRPDAVGFERWVDARYVGQSFELAVPADGWVTGFHAAHAERYGYQRHKTPVEAVTLRVVASDRAQELPVPEVPAADGPPPVMPTSVHHREKLYAALRVRRADLRAGHRLDGPLVVEEYSGTTWVPPEWRLDVDRWGCLHLTAL